MFYTFHITFNFILFLFASPAGCLAAFPSLMSLPVFSTVPRVLRWTLWKSALFGDPVTLNFQDPHKTHRFFRRITYSRSSSGRKQCSDHCLWVHIIIPVSDWVSLVKPSLSHVTVACVQISCDYKYFSMFTFILKSSIFLFSKYLIHYV